MADFFKGTWAISIQRFSIEPFSIVVKDGQWNLVNATANPNYPFSGGGTWKYAGGTLEIVVNQTNHYPESRGTATGVPARVDPSDFPLSLSWTTGSYQDPHKHNEKLSLKWDQDTQTLTITSLDVDGGTQILEAKRS